MLRNHHLELSKNGNVCVWLPNDLTTTGRIRRFKMDWKGAMPAELLVDNYQYYLERGSIVKCRRVSLA